MFKTVSIYSYKKFDWVACGFLLEIRDVAFSMEPTRRLGG